MNISDLLSPEAVLAALKAQNKKQLLQELAARAPSADPPAGKAHLRNPDRARTPGHHRRRPGHRHSPWPHGGCDKITGVFARLESAIDYEAVDSQPVDLVFMLLAPENAGADHLKALARVSRLLRNQATCEKLRAATTRGSDLRHSHRSQRSAPAVRLPRRGPRPLLSASDNFLDQDRVTGAWPGIGPWSPTGTADDRIHHIHARPHLPNTA